MNESPALDLSRAPRGELVASLLVQAVAGHGDLPERHYLELKGPDNLDSKASKQKVAKFILGAANRMPDKAAEAFEGCAVMVLGIRDGQVIGLPPIEMLELNKIVEQHTGPDGPRWDFVPVPVLGSINQVLVIVVEPPMMGKPAWICRASGEGMTDGRVYIRADGETREATSAEQDLLRERGAVAPIAPVELEVQVVGKVVPIVIDEAKTLEAYIAVIERELVSAIPLPEPTKAELEPFKGGLASSALAGHATMMERAKLLGITEEPEKRTKEQYRAEIERWEKQFREAWPDAIRKFIGYAFQASEIEVTNKTKTFLHDVEVTVHLEGAVEAVTYFERPSDINKMEIGLPMPPRKWGPTPYNPLAGTVGNWMAASALPMNIVPSSYRPSSTWKNTGSVTIEIGISKLRPEKSFRTEDEDSVLMVLGEMPEAICGTWRATARTYNDVFTGTVEVELEKVRDLTKALRRYLELE